MENQFTQALLFTLFCTAQISVNICAMNNEQRKLLPEIQGNIVTKIVNLYLNELETVEEYYAKEIHPYRKEDRLPLYQKNTHTLIKKIMYWIECTRFNPVQHHIDINTTSTKGNTLLYHIIKTAGDKKEDQPSRVYTFTHYLLEHKANPNIQNNDGKTAFWHCMWNCLERFNFSGFYSKSQKKRFKNLIRLFLKHDADPNVSSSDGGLCLLAVREYSNVVKEIVRHSNVKAFANNKDKDGCTPACHAATILNLDFLGVLANAHADFTLKSEEKTPLECALQCKRECRWMERSLGAGHVDMVINFLHDATNKNNQ